MSYYPILVTAVPTWIFLFSLQQLQNLVWANTFLNHHDGFSTVALWVLPVYECLNIYTIWRSRTSKLQSGSVMADWGNIKGFVRRILTNCHRARHCWDMPVSAIPDQRLGRRESVREKREMKGIPLYKRWEGKMKHGPVRQRPALCPLIDQPVSQGRWKKKWACWGEGRRKGWERKREGQERTQL